MSHELFDGSREGSSESAGDTRIRRFFVSAPTDAALFDPIIPTLGSTYPGGNPNTPDIFKLKVDSYNVRKTGDGSVSEVDVLYSSNRSLRQLHKPDRTHTQFKAWEVSYQDTAIDLVTVYSYPLRVPGVAAQTARGFENIVYKVEETRTVWERHISLTNISHADVATIGRQNNKIHYINGRLYRFKAGNFRQTEKAAWEGSYTWIEDTGTPVPFEIAGLPYPTGYPAKINIGPVSAERSLYLPPVTGNRWLVQVGINDTNDYIRSPYHTITYHIDEDFVPLHVETTAYTLSENGGLGWQTLPGDLGF